MKFAVSEQSKGRQRQTLLNGGTVSEIYLVLTVFTYSRDER